MKNEEIKKKLQNYANSAAIPDVLSRVKEAGAQSYRAPGPTYAEKELSLALARRARLKRLSVFAAAAVFVLLAIIIIPSVLSGEKVYASVILNGKPNFEISIDEAERVVAVKTDKKGRAVLADISYKKQRLETVLTELIGACREKGYIKDGDINYSLCSVHCLDVDKAEKLKERVDSVIAHCAGGEAASVESSREWGSQ